jgi:long-chain acyl-CoA synthetase
MGQAARGFARKLGATGLQKSHTVVFWGENRPEWLACYWVCLIAGIVVVPIDSRSSAAFVIKIRTLVRARVVLVGDDAQANLNGVDLDGVERWRFSDLDWHADGPMPAITASRDDIVQIIFTSGATSEPKGVVIRHRNVLANVVPVEREIAKYRRHMRPFHPLRFLNLLPLSHMFGQSMATTIPPMVRGTVVFTNSFNPHDLLRLIHARRVSVLVCVPKILDVLREHVAHTYPESVEPPPAGVSIPGRWWKYRRVHGAFGTKFWAFIVGAAALPTELEEFWRRMGFAVIQGYGLTETAPIVTLNHPFRKNKKGSVGKPLAGVEVRIADDGEILVRGENVTSGYYVALDHPGAATNGTPTTDDDPFDTGGWLHTGDIGERDAEGQLFIKGRMIVSADGLNVYPEDIERVLNDLPGVRESAIVGVTSEGDERVHAVLVIEAGIDQNVIVEEANALVQNHQRIRSASMWPTDALPRADGTKKLRRTTIREWVSAGEQPFETEGGSTMDTLIARFAGRRAVSETTTLDDLGLSSLERVELMVALEDKFQIRIDEAPFADVRSIQ